LAVVAEVAVSLRPAGFRPITKAVALRQAPAALLAKGRAVRAPTSISISRSAAKPIMSRAKTPCRYSAVEGARTGEFEAPVQLVRS